MAKNELEKLLLMIKKGVEELENVHSIPGIVFEDGSKMSFKTALRGIKRLEEYFSIKGSLSIGLCMGCFRFDTRAHSNKNFGECSVKGKSVHSYDSCEKYRPKELTK